MFYIDMFKALAEHEVRYLLVGGLAMNLHGVPRMTMDIDLVIALDVENIEGFIDAVSSMELKPVLPVTLNDLMDPEKREEWSKERNMIAFALRPPEPAGPTLDVLLDPPIDLDMAFSRVVYREVDSIRVPLASIDDMIEMKNISGRAQDLSDIEHLLRLKKEGS